MTALLAISRRELLAILLAPTGAIVAALFLFFTSLVYFVLAPLIDAGFSQGQPASLRLFFEIGIWVFFLIAPAISMRSISEELRLGTYEMLMTAPVRESQVILGKFLGSLGFLIVMLLPTIAYVIALAKFGRPDFGEIACGYLGLILIGAAYLATGMLASTLTSSQVLAYIGTAFFWLILLLATMALPHLAAALRSLAEQPDTSEIVSSFLRGLESAASLLSTLSPMARVRDFVNGLADSFNVAYFVVFTSVFLVVAVRSLEMRRWP